MLTSVTITFGVHTDGGGNERSTYITIACKKGGPTSNFRYTAKEETSGQKSLYAISTEADCSSVGPAPPGPAPPGPIGYWCVGNATCLYGPQPDPRFRGGTEAECKALCHPAQYRCEDNKCVASETGGSLEQCTNICS